MRPLPLPFGVSVGHLCSVCVFLCVCWTLELHVYTSSPEVILSAHKAHISFVGVRLMAVCIKTWVNLRETDTGR